MGLRCHESGMAWFIPVELGLHDCMEYRGESVRNLRMKRFGMESISEYLGGNHGVECLTLRMHSVLVSSFDMALFAYRYPVYCR